MTISPTEQESLVGFYDLSPYTNNRRVYTTDIITALEATTQLLDFAIGNEADAEKLQGLATASRIFAGMLADRYTGEEVVRKQAAAPSKPPGTRKQKQKGNVVALVRESSQGVGNG